jgi:SAM-dependent methyltransferase
MCLSPAPALFNLNPVAVERPSLMPQKDFTHVANFTGYMAVVFQILTAGKPGQRILDLPAGNGLLAARLRADGHTVVCADINREKVDYVFADLNERLPFADGEFDAVSCMEGIEHTLEPTVLIRELCRITKPGGRIILTTPNIQNVFSRFKFLCTGCFFLFSPWGNCHLQPGELKDRGHISPLGYLQLRYFFRYRGAKLVAVQGDRWKKKWLLPLLLPFLALGWVWSRMELSRQKEATAEHREMLQHLFSPAALFGRSLILVFEKA